MGAVIQLMGLCRVLMVEAPNTGASKKTMSSLTWPCVGSPAAEEQEAAAL